MSGVRVRLWRKGHEGEQYSLIGERTVDWGEMRELRKRYDVEVIDLVENYSTRTIEEVRE